VPGDIDEVPFQIQRGEGLCREKAAALFLITPKNLHMEKTARANGLLSSPGAGLFIAHKQETPVPEDRYAGLLQKIALSFGLGESQAGALVHHTYAYAGSHPEDPAHPLPQRVRLAKILVYKCVFTLSCELFRQSGCPAEKDQPPSLYYSYRCRPAGEGHLHHMPLSFRAVYILSHLIGFTERETAEILNTTVLNVKERCTRARAFLATPSNQLH
jgi:hypothetical protein